MDSDDARGDDVYQPDGSEVQDDEGLLDNEDTLLNDGVDDPLDEGYSPPERPLGVDHEGTTELEQEEGETLDERLAEEVPDVAPVRGDGLGDTLGTDGEPLDDEVGDDRSGRLVAPDEGAREDAEKDMVASDVGIDGAGASSEEAAVHLVEDNDEELD
ncbi:DUF5709 domain-containing protein [Streptomyces tsukubensis]|uniref:DUF5709 domain-containing protein n=1 Tax=Streptomyces tsukubensis TaxID=83656 RepID=A0A1V4A771_9ACTN|nr:DUF5709 domain-containing protein [Streptomyces tsukubensis]OON77297.1 hypothetical protein B1H18_18790 [Streptomyces tsukubensis]QFR92371.1 hypothetical protein GBW32_04015 [Streptomyces tsukubensis]